MSFNFKVSSPNSTNSYKKNINSQPKKGFAFSGGGDAGIGKQPLGDTFTKEPAMKQFGENYYTKKIDGIAVTLGRPDDGGLVPQMPNSFPGVGPAYYPPQIIRPQTKTEAALQREAKIKEFLRQNLDLSAINPSKKQEAYLNALSEHINHQAKNNHLPYLAVTKAILKSAAQRNLSHELILAGNPEIVKNDSVLKVEYHWPISIQKDPVDRNFLLQMADKSPNLQDFSPIQMKNNLLVNQIKGDGAKEAFLKKQNAALEKIVTLNQEGKETIHLYPTEVQNNPQLRQLIQETDGTSHLLFQITKKNPQSLSETMQQEIDESQNYLKNIRIIALRAPGVLSQSADILTDLDQAVSQMKVNLLLEPKTALQKDSIYQDTGQSHSVRERLIRNNIVANHYEKISQQNEGIRVVDFWANSQKSLADTDKLIKYTNIIAKRRRINSGQNKTPSNIKLDKYLKSFTEQLTEIKQQLKKNLAELTKSGLHDPTNLATELDKLEKNPDYYSKSLHNIYETIILSKHVGELENGLAFINLQGKMKHDLEMFKPLRERQDKIKNCKKFISQHGGNKLARLGKEISKGLPSGQEGMENLSNELPGFVLSAAYEAGGGRIVDKLWQLKHRNWVGSAPYEFKKWENNMPNGAPLDAGLAADIATKIGCFKQLNNWFYQTFQEKCLERNRPDVGDYERELRHAYLEMVDIILNDKQLPQVDQMFSKKLRIDIGRTLKACYQNNQVDEADVNLVRQNPDVAFGRLCQIKDISAKLTDHHKEFFQSLRTHGQKEVNRDNVTARALNIINEGKLANTKPEVFNDSLLNLAADMQAVNALKTVNYNHWKLFTLRATFADLVNMMGTTGNKMNPMLHGHIMAYDQEIYVDSNTIQKGLVITRLLVYARE